MNLITQEWIPVIREDGKLYKIEPWQIAERDNPVIEINAPRPDFQGALYQFLIGLLQTCFAPEDEDEWLERWEETPSPEKLRGAFKKVAVAFELYNPDEPAFMQDYDLSEEKKVEELLKKAPKEKDEWQKYWKKSSLSKTASEKVIKAHGIPCNDVSAFIQGVDLDVGELKPIPALLMEAPGAKTIKDNLDHFIKRGVVECMCSGCAASALFSLQLNAPSGGQGHRVGLRGGGPLTTLIVSDKNDECLWKKLWLNVLNKEDIACTSDTMNPSVLPWMGETRLSEQKGAIVTPETAQALQMYWGAPRRIRLNELEDSGDCDICGKTGVSVFKTYRTKNFGVNYEGAWIHPLTPYRIDPKKEKPPLSLKGQEGGLGYRHWLGLVLQEPESGDQAATIVRFFNEERRHLVCNGQAGALWCFGFDMDNMKARCWYDSRFPIFNLDEGQKKNLIDWAGELIRSAREVVRMLRGAVKSAWFRRPEDAKGSMSIIDAQFWQATETDFYRLLDKLAHLPGETRMAPPDIYSTWFNILQKYVFQIFEHATMGANLEDLDLKRIVAANQILKKNFYGNKQMKSLKAKAIKEEAV